MKTLSKVAATAAITAGLLLAGPGLALAAENSPQAPAGSEAAALTHQVTLKPISAQVSDQLCASTTKGLPWISAAYPFSQNPIAASPMQTAQDGSTWRMISLAPCGAPSACYISDRLVATDAQRATDAPVAILRPRTAAAADPAIDSYQRQFTGTGQLAPFAGVYYSTADNAPRYVTAAEAITVPMTPAFEENGERWQGVIAPGMKQAVVKASEVASFELTSCNNAAVPFSADPATVPAATVASVRAAAYDAALYNQMITAANLAIDARDAGAKVDATVTVEGEAGMGPAGITMLVGGSAIMLAAATGVAVAGIRGKKAKR